MSSKVQTGRELLPGVPDPRHARSSTLGAGGIPGPEQASPAAAAPGARSRPTVEVEEIGGRGGLDPTRYGDWEIDGRCVDF